MGRDARKLMTFAVAGRKRPLTFKFSSEIVKALLLLADQRGHTSARRGPRPDQGEVVVRDFLRLSP